MSGKIKNILINTASAVFTVIARTVGILLYVMIYFMDAIVLSLITSYFMVTKKDPVRYVNPILIRWMLSITESIESSTWRVNDDDEQTCDGNQYKQDECCVDPSDATCCVDPEELKKKALS